MSHITSLERPSALVQLFHCLKPSHRCTPMPRSPIHNEPSRSRSAQETESETSPLLVFTTFQCPSTCIANPTSVGTRTLPSPARDKTAAGAPVGGRPWSLETKLPVLRRSSNNRRALRVQRLPPSSVIMLSQVSWGSW